MATKSFWSKNEANPIEVDRCASHAHVSAIDTSSVSFAYEEGCEVKVSRSELALVEQNVFKQ